MQLVRGIKSNWKSLEKYISDKTKNKKSLSATDSENKYVKRCFFCISLHLKLNGNFSQLILMISEDNLSL